MSDEAEKGLQRAITWADIAQLLGSLMKVKDAVFVQFIIAHLKGEGFKPEDAAAFVAKHNLGLHQGMFNAEKDFQTAATKVEKSTNKMNGKVDDFLKKLGMLPRDRARVERVILR